MKTLRVSIAGEITPGKPLHPSAEVIELPADLIEEPKELVYRMREKAIDARRGDLLVVDLRSRARTGEVVFAVKEGRVYIGRFWAKHGLRELRFPKDPALTGFQIVGAVNQILRP